MENIDKISNDDSSVGLGVDIVDVKNMRDIIERTPSFVDKNFSQQEIEYCKKSTRFAEHFSTHFAAKEAVLKALGCGFAKGVSTNDIEVFHNKNGKPYVVLSGKTKEISEDNNVVDVPISLSFTNSEAVAVAIAMTKDSSSKNEVLNKTVDPAEELSRQFKEVKKIIDEQS